MVAAVRRSIRHFAATFARGLALVHHQIAGDEYEAERRLAGLVHRTTNPADRGEKDALVARQFIGAAIRQLDVPFFKRDLLAKTPA